MKSYNNNMNFIYAKPHLLNLTPFFCYILIILSFLFLLNYKSYSKIHIKGIVSNNKIIVPTSTYNISNIKNSKKMKIDNRLTNFKIYEFSEIYNDGNINLQDVVIQVDFKNKLENEVVDLTFYYNKDYIVKKILKGVFK